MRAFHCSCTAALLVLLSASAQCVQAQSQAAAVLSAVPHPHAISANGNGPFNDPVSLVGPAAFGGAACTVQFLAQITSSRPAAEEHIAVDPNNPNNLVGMISDFALRGGWNTSKYGVSTDNGATWSESYVPLDGGGFPTTGDGLSWEANSDPVIAIDKSGNVFLENLYFNGSNNANGLYVGVGTLSAGSVTAAKTYLVAGNSSPSAQTFEDKPWIAVDNSSKHTSGNVSVTWTRFTSTSDMIMFSLSSDHGKTWSKAKQISLPVQNGSVQGSAVAVGPDGSINVVYSVFFNGGVEELFFTRSTNSGKKFSTPAQITFPFISTSFSSSYRTPDFGSIAVGPNGNIHIVYSEQTNTNGSEVDYIRSTDGGATFSSHIVINDISTGQQFFPSIAVDQASGQLHVSYFSTENGAAVGQSDAYDVKATCSSDGGNTWSLSTRVTPATIIGYFGFIGDYAGIAAAGGYAHPVWNDGGFYGGVLGFGGGALQTATLK